jgi:hypothetical protein
MRFPAILALGSFLSALAACSEPPPPAATYEAPSQTEAAKAFKAALVVDTAAISGKVREFRESDMTAMGSASGVANNDNLIASRHGKLMIDAIQRFQILDCAWQPAAVKKIPSLARERIKDTAPKAAYFCTFQVNYQLNPPYGKKLSNESDGYFFKTDAGFVFAGHYNDPYA